MAPVVVKQTPLFAQWLAKLAKSDGRAAARIKVRIERLSLGNPGDVKYFDGIGELRIDYGPGYRVYFAPRGKVLVILLCGGDKASQDKDIKAAVAMLADL